MENNKAKIELEKMLKGELYDATIKELHDDIFKCKELCFDYNQLKQSETEKKKALIKKIFKSIGEKFSIKPPFYCDLGYNIIVGENFHANHNLVILDENIVEIGNNVFIGPNVGIYTAGHPIDVKVRNSGLEYAKKITIGNNVWIGANVCILPGVTIGDNITIGAGSVVTKDIPSNVTAFGNPCKVYKVNKENIGKK